MDLFKTLAGKVGGGIVGLVVVTAAISWWRMDEATRHALLGGTGKTVAWFFFVLLFPWATFFISTAVGRLESNLAGAALVAGYTLLDTLLLLWLFGWHGFGIPGWTFVAVGSLMAAVYNVFVCDWIAEKLV